ncbi:(2Fe-2S)-binding protein [Paractinoplanes maris]|uniref:(2Fe-2S)-binding protein n=1 Tax=Paractinoplanes maris TaxID=1734446 RepID=UPI0020206BFC|nr:2Fe-2S iron-sulfur cluster-binding protein [Actinoplanes maris]
MPVRLVVNENNYEVDADPRRSLLAALRADCEVTSAHAGCADGTCGACTVLVDGDAVRSCLMLAVQCDGVAVRTAEGLTAGHPLRAALPGGHELCRPGLVMLAAGAMRHDGDLAADPGQMSRLLAANLCTCADHDQIKRSVVRAASLPPGASIAAIGPSDGPSPDATGP